MTKKLNEFAAKFFLFGMQELNRLLLSSRARDLCEIALVKGKGRGLFSRRFRRAGDVIVEDDPLASASRHVERGWSASFAELDESLLGSQVSRVALRCVAKVADEVLDGQHSPTWEKLRVLARPSDKVPLKFGLDRLVEAVPHARGVFTEDLLQQLVGVLHLNVVALENSSAIFAAQSMINHSW
jgi:hypothetical protein